MPKIHPASPERPAAVKPIMTLEGHKGAVDWVEVYAEGRRALSASADKTLKVWDLETGMPLHSLEGHSNVVDCDAVYADGGRALSASWDTTLKVWDLETGRILHSLEGHSSVVTHIAVYAKGRRALSTSYDKTLKVWNLETGTLLHPLEGHSEAVLHAVVYAEGRRALSASLDKTLKVWDLETGMLLHSLEEHSNTVHHAAIYAENQRALSASYDKTLKVWDLETGDFLRSLKGHSSFVYHVVVYSNGRRALSASHDNTLKVWNLETLKLLHSLEGHTLSVSHSAVYDDGRRALSASADKTLKVWDLETGRLLHSLEGHSGTIPHVVVYAEGRRALSASHDGTLKVWDLAALETLAPTEASSLYINARVVLVGDSGVGKTGLRQVLTGQPLTDIGSTHGRFVTPFHSEVVVHGTANTLTREALLWDLAGQPGYRLIHQFHLGGVAVALVVFDAKSDTDPLAGVRYWTRALKLAEKAQGTSSGPRMRKFLVAARVDRGGPGVSARRLSELKDELGFDAVFQTSASTLREIPELADAIRAAIAWEEMPSVVRTDLFEKMQGFLKAMKVEGDVLEEEEKLFRRYGDGLGEREKFPQFQTCVDRLRDAGLIRRLSFGGLVLLQPEVLDNYAAALINHARQEPDGFGCVSESVALEGRFEIPKEAKVASPAQERLLLTAMVEDLVANEIALLEPVEGGRALIFPSQFTRERPDLPDPAGKAAVWEFEGAVQNIYTTLAVRLAQSGFFEKDELWKNAVTYQLNVGAGRFGFFVTEPEEGRGRLTVFYENAPAAMARELFERFVEEHLATHALTGTVTRRRVVECAGCGTPVSDRVVGAVLKLGRTEVECQVCFAKVSLVDTGAAPATAQTVEKVREMERTAEANRRLAEARQIIHGKRLAGDFDVFLSHRTPDKPEVRKIADALEARGILPWLDEREIRPGELWQEALTKQIAKVKTMAVFLGDVPYDRYQKLEAQKFLSEFVNRGAAVIPLILRGAKSEPEVPEFLPLFQAVDFRKADPDPLEQLIWGITGDRASSRSMR